MNSLTKIFLLFVFCLSINLYSSVDAVLSKCIIKQKKNSTTSFLTLKILMSSDLKKTLFENINNVHIKIGKQYDFDTSEKSLTRYQDYKYVYVSPDKSLKVMFMNNFILLKDKKFTESFNSCKAVTLHIANNIEYNFALNSSKFNLVYTNREKPDMSSSDNDNGDNTDSTDVINLRTDKYVILLYILNREEITNQIYEDISRDKDFVKDVNLILNDSDRFAAESSYYDENTFSLHYDQDANFHMILTDFNTTEIYEGGPYINLDYVFKNDAYEDGHVKNLRYDLFTDEEITNVFGDYDFLFNYAKYLRLYSDCSGGFNLTKEWYKDRLLYNLIAYNYPINSIYEYRKKNNKKTIYARYFGRDIDKIIKAGTYEDWSLYNLKDDIKDILNNHYDDITKTWQVGTTPYPQSQKGYEYLFPKFQIIFIPVDDMNKAYFNNGDQILETYPLSRITDISQIDTSKSVCLYIKMYDENNFNDDFNNDYVKALKLYHDLKDKGFKFVHVKEYFQAFSSDLDEEKNK